MKVGKEEIVGALHALDRWLNGRPASLERASWRPRLARIAAGLPASAADLPARPVPEPFAESTPGEGQRVAQIVTTVIFA